jgi:protease IV
LESPVFDGDLDRAEETVRKKGRYLELLLKEEIVEGATESSIFSRKTKTALQDILDALRKAAKDPRIVALSLTLENLSCGWAQLSDLRRALLLFRNSGKLIYCFMPEAGNAEYYLASVCDQIFMPPASSLQLIGLSAEVFFFRDLLDRFGIEPQLQSMGEYKSAAETLMRKGMSEPAREQLEALIDDSYTELRRALENRGFSYEETTAKINAGPYTVREALKEKLLDGMCYQDELEEKFKEKFGKKIKSIPAEKYFKEGGFFKHIVTFRRPRIAVINISGFIDSGESRRGQTGRWITGSATVEKFLDHANKSRRVRAVLLRVDSPGGSGLASDLIWRKISLVCKSKPVVVSFGNVAASGGYYIATPAARIFAESNTITGSIGVLAGKIVAGELMSRLNIQRESIHRGEHAEFGSPFSSFSQTESDKLNQQMREFYLEDFVKKVAEGRKLAAEEVDRVGRGRVWSGKRAKEIQLVDEIGGLSEAIQEARKLAKIPNSRKTRLVHYYQHRKFWERLLPEFRSPLVTALLPRPTLDALELTAEIAKQKILLIAPYHIQIH